MSDDIFKTVTPGLFVQASSLGMNKVARSIYQEVATVQNDITFPAWGGIYRQLDPTIIARGGGKGIHLYDDVLRDAHAYSVLEKRIMSVISYPWMVRPFSDSELDKQAAQLVQSQLETISFNRIVLDLLWASLYGYAVGEVMWKRDGEQVVVADIISRDQKRFYVDQDYQIRLRTWQNPRPGELVPERKFIWHKFSPRANSPYGRGLGDKLWYLVYFKKQLQTFWLSYCEKFAGPTVMVSIPDGSTPDLQAKALEAAQAISSETEIALPESLKASLLESHRNGNSDIYHGYINLLNEEISKCVLHESVTTSGKEHAARAAVASYNDVRLELVQSDADLLTDTLNEQLVKWIVDLNLPGANYPKLRFDISSPQDLFKRAQRDQYIATMGFRPTVKYIQETYGGEWEQYDGPLGLGLNPSNQQKQYSAVDAAGGPTKGKELSVNDQPEVGGYAH